MAVADPTAAQAISPRVALGAFFRLAERWSLDPRAQARLLALSEKQVGRYRNGELPGELDRDKAERISYLVGIYQALNVIFGDGSERATEWLRRPNRAFGEMAPLDRMLAGNVGDLAFVRGYLEREKTPW